MEGKGNASNEKYRYGGKWGSKDFPHEDGPIGGKTGRAPRERGQGTWKPVRRFFRWHFGGGEKTIICKKTSKRYDSTFAEEVERW